ncbi:hypothetical protein FHX75_13420 [Micromonospora palomenae]|uniref:Uncharacterized protein n=1 Tax=Micromonospora palomenae TaxID=1461247 RepID=A0A561VP91_9ACTN|nr:hypothetical protein FHX75_13420 [Micromonospora palomenae]
MRGLSAYHRAFSVVLAMFALVAAFVLVTATPARAGENTFVEVTPNTAQAGTRVSIRASCDNANNQQATVQSDAFGRVVLRPDNGFLTGAVTIPGNKQPGDYPVDLRCANGNTASTTLTVLNMAQPTKGPATGAGGTAGDRGAGSLLLVGGLAVVTVVAGLGMFGGSRRRAGTSS